MKTKREILFADSGQRWQRSDAYATQPTLEALVLAEQDTQHLPVVSGERWQQDDIHATQPSITLVLQSVEDTQPFRREERNENQSQKPRRWWRTALKKLHQRIRAGYHLRRHSADPDRAWRTKNRIQL